MKISKLHVTGLCEGNSAVTGESPHKRPVTWKMFPFDDVIMKKYSVIYHTLLIRITIANRSISINKYHLFSYCLRIDKACFSVFASGSSKRENLVNSSPPGQNGHHFTDDIFKYISLNENCCISIEISLKCVPKNPIDNMPVLVQIMAWRLLGDKPLSETMLSQFTNAYMRH